jgi:hypothetical protein
VSSSTPNATTKPISVARTTGRLPRAERSWSTVANDAWLSVLLVSVPSM